MLQTYPVIRHFTLMIMFKIEGVNIEGIYYMSGVLEPGLKRCIRFYIRGAVTNITIPPVSSLMFLSSIK